METVLAHAGDDWWEQVILLAGSHSRLAEDLRSELVNCVLDRAEGLRRGSLEWRRDLLLAGRLAGARHGRLPPGPEHARIETALYVAMTDPDLKPSLRAGAADVLDALGWLPKDLYQFVRVRSDDVSRSASASQERATGVATTKIDFWIGKYTVTNLQYARFVQADDFADPELWRGFPKFDERSRAMKEDWGEAGWEWLQEGA